MLSAVDFLSLAPHNGTGIISKMLFTVISRSNKAARVKSHEIIKYSGDGDGVAQKLAPWPDKMRTLST